MRRNLLVTILILALYTPLQAKLVLLGFDATGDDSFTIGLLESLPAGSVLRFTDKAWNGSGFIEHPGNPLSDTYFSYEIGSQLPAGTILNFRRINYDSTRHVTDGNGNAVQGAFGGPAFAFGYVPLENANEAIYVYQGPSFETVEAPLASLRSGVGGGTLFGNSTDFAGTAFENGDMLVYTGPLSVDGPFSLFESLVAEPTNWTLIADKARNLVGQYAPPAGVLSAVSAVPEPSAFFFSASVATAIAANVRRRKKCHFSRRCD